MSSSTPGSVQTLEGIEIDLNADGTDFDLGMQQVEQALIDATESMEMHLDEMTKKFSDDLHTQVMTFGMSSKAAQLYKLQVAGVSSEQLAGAQASMKYLDQLERQQKIMQSLTQYGRQIQSIGRNMSMYLTAPIAGMGAASVYEFTKFDDAMTQARAIMGKLSPEMQKEANDITKSLSEVGKFDPSVLAAGLKNLAAAGLTTEQSLKALPIVEKFATAGAFDLERATQLLTDSQSALGLTVDDASQNMRNMIKVSDALVKAGDQSTASPQQFAEALANGAADAKQWGSSVETVMAILDAYASKGNKGAAAGSDMARAFKLMKKAFEEQGETFKKYGIDVVDKASGEYRNFIDVVADLEHAMQGMTGPQRTKLLGDLGFEALAQGAILPLVGMSKQMRIWETDQKRAFGYTENVAKIQLESFKSKWEQLTNQVKVAAIELGQSWEPTLRRSVDLVSAGIRSWKGLDDNTKSLVVSVGAAVAVIGPLTIGLGVLVSIAGTASSALVTLGIASSASAAGMMVLQTGLVGAALIGGAALTAWLVSIHPDIVDFNEAIAKTGELTKKLSEVQSKGTDNLLADASKMSGDSKVKFLEREVEQAKKNVDGLRNAVGYAKAGVEDYSTTWNLLIGSKELEANKNDLKEAQQHLSDAETTVKKLENALDQAKDSANDLKNNSGGIAEAQQVSAKEVTKLTQALQAEAQTLGEISAEARIAKLALQGHSEEELRGAREAATAIAKYKKDKKDAEKFEKHGDEVKLLQEEAAHFGMNARQIKIFKMELDGATSSQLAAARAADVHLTALEKQKKRTEEAKQLTERLRNPAEVFAARQKELKSFLDEGLVSLETYTGALKEAEHQFGKKYEADFRIKGKDAVLVGSAEAMEMLRHYQTLKKHGDIPNGNPVKGSVVAKAPEAVQKKTNPRKKNPTVIVAKPLPFGPISARKKRNSLADQQRLARGYKPTGKPALQKQQQDKVFADKSAEMSVLKQIADNTAPNADAPRVVLRPANLRS